MIRAPYMTATSSATSATIPRSWVMTITVVPNSTWSFLMSSRICAWTVTSSAVVGSWGAGGWGGWGGGGGGGAWVPARLTISGVSWRAADLLTLRWAWMASMIWSP